MRGKGTPLVFAGVLAAGLIVPAAVDAATVLKSRMTGAQVVNPAGGSPKGVAFATVRTNAARGRICFEISYDGLGAKANAGHLRKGRAGQMARPVVTLFEGRSPSPVVGCVKGVPAGDLAHIERKPAGHYIDLTTRRHPKGAVRGQLRPQTGGSQGGGGLPGPDSGGTSSD